MVIRKSTANRLLVEQLSIENSKEKAENTKLGNIFFLSSCFGSTIMSDISGWLSVEISYILVNIRRSLGSEWRLTWEGGTQTRPLWVQTHRRLFNSHCACGDWLPQRQLWECNQSLKVFAFLYSGTGLKQNLFLNREARCTTCWRRNAARSPQIRTSQAQRQSLWLPCGQVKKMPFTLFQTACSPPVKSTYWHPVTLAKLRTLACIGYFELAFAYYEVTLNSFGRKIFYLVLMLSF